MRIRAFGLRILKNPAGPLSVPGTIGSSIIGAFTMNAKKFALVTAGLCATMFFAACDSTEKQNTSAGAMGEKSACCTDAKKCDAKCTGDAKTCAKSDTECCMKKTATVAPGAVGEKKEGCCSTTKTSATVAPGTMSDKKEGCCSTTKTSATVAPGTVGDKKEGGCSMTTKTSAKAEGCCPAMMDAAKCPVTGTTNG